jgi:ubiquitin C-terminal hydrolase
VKDDRQRASDRPAAAMQQREGHPTQTVCQRPGLANLGDCCFISSVVQALYSCELVRTGLVGVDVLEKDFDADDSGGGDFAHLVARALPGLMRDMGAAGVASAPPHAIPPHALVRAVRSGAGSAFASGQHDAHELLQQLLLLPESDPLTLDPQCVHVEHTHPARAAKTARVAAAPGPQAAVKSMQNVLRCFQGTVHTATCCLECECSTREHDEVFTTLSISCAHSRCDDAEPSVASGLADHFRVERMRGSNKVFCAKHCNALAEAHRQTRLTSLPTILCVHLKLLGESSSRAIAVDQELELQPWCTAATSQCTRYQLVAAVFHTGNSPQCGHYLAYCHTNVAQRRKACLRPRLHNVGLNGVTSNGELAKAAWLRCDDERIETLSDVESHEVLKGDGDSRKGSTPYICFYAQAPAAKGILNEISKD